MLQLYTHPACLQHDPGLGHPESPARLHAVLAALDRNKKYLRGEVAHRVNLKFAPDIRFMLDERFDEAERIDKLLRTPAVRRDLDEDEGK